MGVAKVVAVVVFCVSNSLCYDSGGARRVFPLFCLQTPVSFLHTPAVHLLADLGLDFSSLETGAKVHVAREINPVVSAGIQPRSGVPESDVPTHVCLP